MDSCKRNDRVITRERTIPNATELILFAADVIYGAADAAAAVGEYIIYVISYALSAVYRFFKSEKAAYFFDRYGKLMRGISASFAFYIIIGIVGGLEASLISFAVGLPVCVILFACINILGNGAD